MKSVKVGPILTGLVASLGALALGPDVVPATVVASGALVPQIDLYSAATAAVVGLGADAIAVGADEGLSKYSDKEDANLTAKDRLISLMPTLGVIAALTPVVGAPIAIGAVVVSRIWSAFYNGN